MYKQRFSIGDLVVVKVNGANKIGVLVSRSVMKGSRIFNVKMEIKTINGFSGHSNRRQLMDYVKRLNPRPDKVITCHGDPYKTTDLASSIHRSYKIETKSPVNLDSVRIH